MHVIVKIALPVECALLLSLREESVRLGDLCIALRMQTIEQCLEFRIVQWGCHIWFLLSTRTRICTIHPGGLELSRGGSQQTNYLASNSGRYSLVEQANWLRLCVIICLSISQ
jgi:hypothetical protein